MIFLEWTQFEQIKPTYLKIFPNNQGQDIIYRCIRWCENNTAPGKYSYKVDKESNTFVIGFEYQADHIMFEIFYKQLVK